MSQKLEGLYISENWFLFCVPKTQECIALIMFLCLALHWDSAAQHAGLA